MNVREKLYDISPALYRVINRAYGATSWHQRREARALEAMQSAIDRRIEREGQILKDHLKNDLTVRTGPFSGMKYALAASGSVLGPKIVGSYESQIQPWVEEALHKNYKYIIDVGCADGFYAVGFALRAKSSEILAYDVNPLARQQVENLATLNEVAGKIVIKSLCTHMELRELCRERALIFCDIEGAEDGLLDPKMVPELSFADMIIETHDFLAPGLTARLVERFIGTHKIEIVYNEKRKPSDYAVIHGLSDNEKSYILDEGRQLTQCWMRLQSYTNGFES